MKHTNRKPSGSFGTRLNEEAYFVSREQQRAAVLAICYFAGTADEYAAELPAADVREMLDALGLDPRVGKLTLDPVTGKVMEEVENATDELSA